MNLRFLLFQMRRSGDPIRGLEIESFARSLGCSPAHIGTLDLARRPPTADLLRSYDAVLIGGAGDFSVPKGGPWLNHAMEAMRMLDTLNKPTFASCWGFQALAAALGGAVVADPERAELGTLELQVTEDGRADPVFGSLAPSFKAHVGHNDTVDILPPNAVALASSDLVANHAYHLVGKPIYATQFHPELRVADMLARLRIYPHYVTDLVHLTEDAFNASLKETPRANLLLRSFVAHVFQS